MYEDKGEFGRKLKEGLEKNPHPYFRGPKFKFSDWFTEGGPGHAREHFVQEMWDKYRPTVNKPTGKFTVLRNPEAKIAQPIELGGAWKPLQAVAPAYVPVALMSLGAQIAMTSVVRMPADLSIIAAVRLLVGPLAGLGLVWAMGLGGTLAQVLVIGVAGPTAIAAAVVALEFKNRPDFASSAVLVSTLAAGLTVPITIFLVQNFL